MKQITIKLTPKTKKGRDKINRWGNRWYSISEQAGKTLLVACKDNSAYLPISARWVSLQDDPDFQVSQI